MPKLTIFMNGRNDNYGGDLNERAKYSLTSMIDTFDEVIYVDWNGDPNVKPLASILDLPKTGKLREIVVPRELASELTDKNPNAQKVCEVLARNIAIRRATGDILVSTSLDIIVPGREELDEFIENEWEKDTMYTISRRDIDISEVRKLLGEGPFEKNLNRIRAELAKVHGERRGVQPNRMHPADAFSLINCCGDFQLAHRDIWHDIRGFESDMIYACFADTSVQKKAWVYQHGLEAKYSPPLFHINHATTGGGSDLKTGKAKSAVNDHNMVMRRSKSINDDNWGIPNVDLKENVI